MSAWYSQKMKILCIVGTRPEAIKMAPVIRMLQSTNQIDVRVLATAQHREMLDQVLRLFDIHPDLDFNLMQAEQPLPSLTSRLIVNLDQCLQSENPDVILAQGDTTTVMAAALAAFYRRIPFGHIEAGLRTGNLFNPFPEEMNRQIVARLASWHFAPTKSAFNSLTAEGIPAESIYITGNTVIDALLDKARHCDHMAPEVLAGRRLILLTTHRRENFGEPLREICRAVRYIIDQRKEVEILFPVHPNPQVKEVAYSILGNHSRIRLCEPLDYIPFIAAMKRSEFILSDSGGVQEEAPALGKPVLVLRNETERPEAVEAGVVKLVGANFDRIVGESFRLLDDSDAYKGMARGISPYGDGQAAGRIRDILLRNKKTFH